MKFVIQYQFAIVYPSGKNTAKSEYILRITKQELMNDPEIHTKRMEIFPKYIFLNQTKLPLAINQYGCPENTIICLPNTPLHFAWPNRDNLRMVSIGLSGTQPSDFFYIDELGPIVQQLVKISDLSHAGLIRIERYINKGSNYIKILYEPLERPYYAIKNCSKYFTVAYKEKHSTLPYRYLDVQTQTPFGWEHLGKQHVVMLRFLWGSIKSKPINLPGQEHKFSLEDFIDYNEIEIYISQTFGKIVNVSLESDGYSKILCIRDAPKEVRFQKKNKKMYQYLLSIKDFGVSVISKYEQRNIELLYINLNGLDLKYTDSSVERSIKLTLQSIQIDNQMDYDIAFPVCFYATPSEHQKTFLNLDCVFTLDYDRKPFFYSINEIVINIVPVTVKIQEEQLQPIQDFFSLFGCSDNIAKNQDSLLEDSQEIAMLIKNCIISPIDISVSFRQAFEKKKGNMLVKSLQMAFVNIQELPVTLPSQNYLNVYGKLKLMALRLFDEYQKELTDQRAGMLTGIALFPLRDMRDIGVGITNLFSNKSSSAAGIAKGTAGVIKGTWTGTFGTVSSITSTISNGVLALSHDKQYIKEKQEDERKNQPSNVFEGVGLGLLSVVKSIGSGLAGVVTKPVKGANKDGFVGFLKVLTFVYICRELEKDSLELLLNQLVEVLIWSLKHLKE